MMNPCSAAQSDKTLSGALRQVRADMRTQRKCSFWAVTKSNSIMQLTAAEKEKLTGGLAIEAIEAGIPKLFDKVRKMLKDKKLTFDKILRMYAVVVRAVKDIEAIASEK